MRLLIIWLVAIALGVENLAYFWKDFLSVLAGAIPLLLLMIGALAVYLGFDEAKDKLFKKTKNPAV